MVVNHKHSMAVSAYLTVWEISLCTCVYVLVRVLLLDRSPYDTTIHTITCHT